MKDSVNLQTRAFVVACFGIATFSAMDVVMKGLALELGAYNAMLWRSCIAVLIAGVLYFSRRRVWPTGAVIRLHVLRGCVISVMAFLFFWGLKYLPVAEAIGLSFIAPLIALYLAVVILRETLGRRAIGASLLGVTGAIVIIAGRLSAEFDEQSVKGIGAVLLSAVLYAYNLILQRQQALVAGPREIAFFQNATIILLFGSLAPWLAVLPALSSVPNLTAAATLGIVSMLMMSWAYARAPANRLIPVEYTAFAWAALFGWLAYGETLTLASVIGTVLIVIGCLIAARQEPEMARPVEAAAT